MGPLASHPPLMVPQVLDEMHVWIIVWHDEQHLSAQEIAGLVGCSVQTVYNILSYHHDYTCGCGQCCAWQIQVLMFIC